MIRNQIREFNREGTRTDAKGKNREILFPYLA